MKQCRLWRRAVMTNWSIWILLLALTISGLNAQEISQDRLIAGDDAESLAEEQLARIPPLKPVTDGLEARAEMVSIWDQLTDNEAHLLHLYMSRLEGVHLDPLADDVNDLRELGSAASRSLQPEQARDIWRFLKKERTEERDYWLGHIPSTVSGPEVVVSELGGGPELDGIEGPMDWIAIGWMPFDEFRDICDKEPLTGWKGSHGWTAGSWRVNHLEHFNNLIGEPSFWSLDESWRNRLSECQPHMHYAAAMIQRRWQICRATGGTAVHRRSRECNDAAAEVLAAVNRLHPCIDPRDGED